jgi:hypothetical protein
MEKRKEATDSAMFQLTLIDEYHRRILSILNAPQRACVVVYLRWNLRAQEAIFGEGGGAYWEDITTALKEYWAPEG